MRGRHQGHRVGAVDYSINGRLEPVDQTLISHPRCTKGITGRKTVGTLIPGCDHGQRTTERVTGNVERQILVALEPVSDIVLDIFVGIVESTVHVADSGIRFVGVLDFNRIDHDIG